MFKFNTMLNFWLTITGPVTTWKIAPDSAIKFCEEQKKIWPFFNTPFGSVRKNKLALRESNKIRLYQE